MIASPLCVYTAFTSGKRYICSKSIIVYISSLCKIKNRNNLLIKVYKKSISSIIHYIYTSLFVTKNSLSVTLLSHYYHIHITLLFFSIIYTVLYLVSRLNLCTLRIKYLNYRIRKIPKKSKKGDSKKSPVFQKS